MLVKSSANTHCSLFCTGPGTVLGAGNTGVKKTSLLGIQSSWSRKSCIILIWDGRGVVFNVTGV